MNVFIGEIAGIAMLILIWTLLLKFLKESELVKIDKECFISSYLVMAIGFAYLLLGGFIYNVLGGEASVLKYDVVWGFGDYAVFWQNCEAGRVEGIFSALYLLLARGISNIFFKEYIAGPIYTSFLLTLLSGLMLQGICRKFLPEQWWRRAWFLFFIVPGAHNLFLPSVNSLIAFMIIGVIWIITHFIPPKKPVLIDSFYSRMCYSCFVICLCGIEAAKCFVELMKRG